MPKNEFPGDGFTFKAEESLNVILESLSKENVELSNIISAYGEKLEDIGGALGKEPGGNGSVEEVLDAGKKIKRLLDSIMQTQQNLKNRIESVSGMLK